MAITLADINDISARHTNAATALDFAINHLETALSETRYSYTDVSRPYLEMRRDMPYAILETDLPNTQILVNRNYKPLGSNIDTGGERLVYEDFDNLHVSLTSSQIKTVADQGKGVYLFGDGNPPWSGRAAAKAYLKRLVALRGLL